jgi:hypothetical protein
MKNSSGNEAVDYREDLDLSGAIPLSSHFVVICFWRYSLSTTGIRLAYPSLRHYEWMIRRIHRHTSKRYIITGKSKRLLRPPCRDNHSRNDKGRRTKGAENNFEDGLVGRAIDLFL